MNKLLKCVCCSIMAVLIGFSSVSAADVSKEASVSDEMQSSMEVLRLFGFITDYYDYNTLMSEKVTRADFANIAAKLVNAEENANDSMYYYDVPKNHYAYKSICALTKMGIINGIGENRFEPEGPITVGEAYKILLTLMGYDRRAESVGGYPSGYIQTARNLHIYDGASATENLTRGGMLSAVYKAMKTNVFMPTSFSGGGSDAEYKISDEETLLSIYHNIYYDKGVVKGAEKSSLDGSELDDAGEVKIDDVIYNSETSLINVLGEEIEFFYRCEKPEDEREILWTKPTGTSKTFEVDENSVAGFDKNSFVFSYYDKGGKVRNLTLGRDITVMYNGREVAEDIHKIFELPEYSVKFVQERGKYTAAIVQKADTYVVGSINTTDNIIYDKANSTHRLSLEENDYDYITVEDSNNTKLTIGELAEGMVLSAYASQDKRYMRIVASSNKASGIVNKIMSVDRGKNLYIDDNVYLLPSSLSVPIPNVGDNVTVYIDCKGNAAYVETIAGDYFVAYVYISGIRGSELDSKAALKVFSQDGKVMVLECADKVLCDGVLKKKAEDVIAVFNEVRGDKNSAFKPQIALLKLNNDGKISEIDTAYVNTEAGETVSDSLSVSLPLGSLKFKWTGFLEGRAIIGANTVIFNVPPDSVIKSASDKQFSIKKKADLTDDTVYTVESYKTKERIGHEQFIVMKSDIGGEWDANELPFLVKDVIHALDEDGIVTDALVGYNSAEETTIFGDGEISFDSVKPGMILRIKQNFGKQIEDIQVLFDPEEELDADGKIKEDKQTDGQFSERYGIVKGYVSDVVDGVVKIGRSNPAVIDQMADKQGAPILIYDKQSGREARVSAGAFSDARSYYNDKDDCSVIVMQSYFGTPKMFVIYK